MTLTMRTWMGVITGLTLLLPVGPATGDGLVPMQNGAEVVKDDVCYQGWIDVGGESTPLFPGDEGLVLVPMDKPGKRVTTPSGQMNVNCKGTLPLGAQVEALDAVTGLTIMATLATHDEACQAIALVWPDSCPGENGPFFGSYERVGVECGSVDFDTGEAVYTRDWMGVVTASGMATFNCHFDLNK